MTSVSIPSYKPEMMQYADWVRLEQQSGTTLWQNLGGEGEPPWFGTESRYFYERVMLLQLSEVQNKLVPPPNFLANQSQITDRNRYTLIEWMAEVNDEFKLEEGTLHLAVNLVDRFLAYKAISLKAFQLLGATAHLIACKFLEKHPPFIKDFCIVSDGIFNRNAVKSMEEIILATLAFELHVPTSLSFAAYYWNLLMTGTPVGICLGSLKEVDQAWKQIETKLRAQLLEATYAEHTPSQLAAIAISHTLLESNIPQEVINPVIHRLSGYQIVTNGQHKL